MPRKKKLLGRPNRPLPPRIDATPEEIARVMLTTRPKAQWDYQDGKTVYRCVECLREVQFPETLYQDGKCSGCTTTLAR